jgi:molybdopterin-guanine dinucleotide biosynthesis protein
MMTIFDQPMDLNIVVVSGASSNTGKTTLLCNLLRELTRQQAWEAIKLTRGHYRSCGKDPHACCVSDLLGEQPVIRSGREATYAFGKDTGRYWDAGASNVHWVIATDNQVEQGIAAALSRVQAGGVLVEGTSLLKFIEPAFAVMAVGAEQARIKPSARRALMEGKIDALYVAERKDASALPPELIGNLPIYARDELARLIERIRRRLGPPDALQSPSSTPQTRSVL